MGGYSELIKSFDKTRDYVRDFFIYGFKVRNDFSRKSLRTYDDEKRRVESLLGNSLRYDESIRGRQISISVNSGHINENPLYSIFYSKSFTHNDIKLHFMLCDILSREDALSLRALTEKLSECFDEIFETQTVRNKLNEYLEEGIVVRERRGKTDYYSLSKDTVDSFFGQYEGLDDAVKFFSEGSELGVIGNSILKTAGLKNNLFFMKHNYIVHTLEDILIPDIISAIEEKRFVSFRTFSSKSPDNRPTENTAVPLRIFSGVQTGRRYLVVYLPKYRRFNTFRLDFIKDIRHCGICENYDEINKAFIRNIPRCFGVSFGNRRDHGDTGKVKITFSIDEKREGFIIERLYREKRTGIVEKVGDGKYTLSVDTFDPSELMHWAKTFIGRIVSVEGGNENDRKKFYRDVSRLYEMYKE